MKLKQVFLTLWFCTIVITSLAQASSPEISFRFATKAESQMLVTAIDNYTSNWNQFDIDARLQTTNGKRSQLLTVAMNSVQTWDENEKKKLTNAVNKLNREIKRQKYNLTFPHEIIFLKSDMKDENGASAYTRKNWIAFNSQKLASLNDDDVTKLLAHELFHILTRNNLNFKKELYKIIGFTVADKEIRFPIDVMEKRISNPDISRYDSYATFTINGKAQNCTMILYTNKTYQGGGLFDYLKIGLIPLNEKLIPIQDGGKTIIYSIDMAIDFFDKVGENTKYIINPEEIMAENFSLLFTQTQNLPNPEIITHIQESLQNK